MIWPTIFSYMKCKKKHPTAFESMSEVMYSSSKSTSSENSVSSVWHWKTGHKYKTRTMSSILFSCTGWSLEWVECVPQWSCSVIRAVIATHPSDSSEVFGRELQCFWCLDTCDILTHLSLKHEIGLYTIVVRLFWAHWSI